MRSSVIKRNCVLSAVGNVQHQRALFTDNGPGTELKKLLARVGIQATPNCSCNARARQLDAWGVEEASRPDRIEEAVGWLREEAARRGLPFLDAAARMLVKRAIYNARKAEAKRAKEVPNRQVVELPRPPLPTTAHPP